MMRVTKRPFQTGNDLIKIYRAAAERVKYLQDIDDKLLAYNEVITYCAHAKQCIADDSVKRNQILFWTYSSIGDMFLERNTHTPMADNYLYAPHLGKISARLRRASGRKKLAQSH